MPDEKKEYSVSAPWDTILSNEESDEDFPAVPGIPDGLVRKTMETLDKPIKLEIARKADPNSDEFRKGVAEFRGEKYEPRMFVVDSKSPYWLEENKDDLEGPLEKIITNGKAFRWNWGWLRACDKALKKVKDYARENDYNVVSVNRSYTIGLIFSNSKVHAEFYRRDKK